MQLYTIEIKTNFESNLIEPNPIESIRFFNHFSIFFQVFEARFDRTELKITLYVLFTHFFRNAFALACNY